MKRTKKNISSVLAFKRQVCLSRRSGNLHTLHGASEQRLLRNPQRAFVAHLPLNDYEERASEASCFGWCAFTSSRSVFLHLSLFPRMPHTLRRWASRYALSNACLSNSSPVPNAMEKRDRTKPGRLPFHFSFVPDTVRGNALTDFFAISLKLDSRKKTEEKPKNGCARQYSAFRLTSFYRGFGVISNSHERKGEITKPKTHLYVLPMVAEFPLHQFKRRAQKLSEETFEPHSFAKR